MATHKLNRLATQVAKLTNPLPAAYKPWGYTFAFDMMVRPACLWHGHLSPLPFRFPPLLGAHLIHAHLVHNARTFYR